MSIINIGGSITRAGAGTGMGTRSRAGSWQQRQLQARLTLAEGEFKDKAGNTIIISDLAMSAKIEKLGAPDFGKATLEIYGLPLNVMEQLSTLAMQPLYTKRNFLQLFAGDEYHGMSECFNGSIVTAGADFNSAPDIKFKVDAQIGYFGSVTAQGENVIAGSQKAADFIKRQMESAGFTFENQGVSTSIQNAVFSGSPIEQARQCAHQIGAELLLDDGLAILMQNGAQRKGTTPKLSATSGLLGYPVMTNNGITCRAIYDPAFTFGGAVEIETAVPKCSGVWRITKLEHELSCNLDKEGKWESTITALDPNMKDNAGKA